MHVYTIYEALQAHPRHDKARGVYLYAKNKNVQICYLQVSQNDVCIFIHYLCIFIHKHKKSPHTVEVQGFIGAREELGYLRKKISKK